MPKIVKQLTDLDIKKAKIKEKDYKLSDGKGLFLIIKSNGTKFFRFDFVFGEKRKSTSFGIYPLTNLKKAREMRDEAKLLLQKNINPISVKRNEKLEEKITFYFVMEKWLEDKKNKISEDSFKNYKQTLEKNLSKNFQNLDVKNIKRKHILDVLNEISNAGYKSAATKVYSLMKKIFQYAILNYVNISNPIDFKISDVVGKYETKNHSAAIEEVEIKELIQKIKRLDNSRVEHLHYSPLYALKIMPYIFMRVSSFLSSKWEHIDLQNNTWYFPAENMKTKKEYLYPIPIQVRELLLKLKDETVIDSEFVFHSAQNRPEKHLSRATVNTYLKKWVGYEGDVTLHGFRSTFSTIAHEFRNEHKKDSLIIEACLTHCDKDIVRRTYNRESKYKYLEDKKMLIDWYARYIDNLCS